MLYPSNIRERAGRFHCFSHQCAQKERPERAASVPGTLSAKPLQLPHERDELLLLLLGQLRLQDQVEELYRVFQRQKPAVMEVGR